MSDVRKKNIILPLLLHVSGFATFVSLCGNTQAVSDECSAALGMQSGQIRDKDISASSTFDEESVGAANSRLRTEVGGGAWCPQNQITTGAYEYLQIRLGERVVVVTAVATQGRYGAGDGVEFATAYTLDYRRPGSERWMQYRNASGERVLAGNTDTTTVLHRRLDPPLHATELRLVPFSRHPRTMCVRVELYGCDAVDALTAYSVVQAEKGHRDETYDGELDVDTSLLTGGLGQLTDGVVAPPQLKQPLTKQWMLWRRQKGAKSLYIHFLFDEVRNFSSVRVHTARSTADGATPFRRAILYPSPSSNGDVYDAKPVIYEKPNRKHDADTAFWIEIPLDYRLAKAMKMHLEFNSNVMVISEIQFNSQAVGASFNGGTVVASIGPNKIDDTHLVQNSLEVETEEVTADVPSALFIALFGAVLASAVLCLVAVLVTMGGRRWGVCNGRSSPIYSGLKTHRVTPPSVPSGSLSQLTIKQHLASSGSDNSSVSPVRRPPWLQQANGGQQQQLLPNRADPARHHVTLGLAPNGSLYLTRNNKNTADVHPDYYGVQAPSVGPTAAEPGRFSTFNNRTTAGAAGARAFPAGEAKPRPHWQAQFDFPPPPDYTDESEYAEPDIESSSAAAAATLPWHVSSGRQPPSGPYRQLPQRNVRSPRQESSDQRSLHYAASQICIPTVVPSPATARRPLPPAAEQQQTASSSPKRVPPPPGTMTDDSFENEYRLIEPEPNPIVVGYSSEEACGRLSLPSPVLPVTQLPRSRIKFGEMLGEGEFGQVYLALLNASAGDTWDDKQLVAVKLLTDNAGQSARDDFEREMSVLSRLHDPNIIQLVGACRTNDGPPCMLVEYLPFGDLYHYLRGADPAKLGFGGQLYLGQQIASGMKYLEGLRYVHRDLAARNCVVGARLALKIGDLGMARRDFVDDYCRVDDDYLVPIRWMAWESVARREFSPKSDVWAFGVTLWEVLSYARQRPFAALSDAAVLANARRQQQLAGVGGGGGVSPDVSPDASPPAPASVPLLPAPDNCPRDIYDLMTECWRTQESTRPSFREIHLFLMRKNLGFQPSSAF